MGSTRKDEPEDRRMTAYNLNIHYWKESDEVGENKFVTLLPNEIQIGNHKVPGRGRGRPQQETGPKFDGFVPAGGR